MRTARDSNARMRVQSLAALLCSAPHRWSLLPLRRCAANSFLRFVRRAVTVTEAEIKRLFRKFKKLDVDKSGQ